MFSTDNKIFEEESAVRRRMVEYGSLFDALTIVVVSRGSFEAVRISENVTVQHVAVSNFFSGVWRTLFGISVDEYKNADIVTAQDPFELGSIARKAARKLGVPLQLQVHTDFLSPHFATTFRRKIQRFLAKRNLPHADCIRTVSVRIRDSLSNAKGQMLNVTVLPIFVDIEKIRNTEPQFDLHEKYPQFDFIVLMVGRLAKEKNHALALRAFRDVVANHPKASLVIIGDGKERDDIKFQISDLGLEENVILEKWNDNIISYYKTADVFLLTSNYEGFGLVLVEAAAAECSIVTTDVGIVGEYLQNDESAFVCPVSDKACVAERIAAYKKRPELRSLYALKAQSAVEPLLITKEDYLKRFKESFEQCLQKQTNGLM